MARARCVLERAFKHCSLAKGGGALRQPSEEEQVAPGPRPGVAARQSQPLVADALRLGGARPAEAHTHTHTHTHSAPNRYSHHDRLAQSYTHAHAGHRDVAGRACPARLWTCRTAPLAP